MHCTGVGTARCAVRSAQRADPTSSILRRRKSKTPRKPASVFPLPVGEVSKIECRSSTAGTQSNCAWLNPGKLSWNHFDNRGCKRRERICGSPATFAVTIVDLALLTLRIYRKVFVLETLGNAFGSLHLNLFRRLIQRLIGFATLLRATHIGGGVTKRNAR